MLQMLITFLINMFNKSKKVEHKIEQKEVEILPTPILPKAIPMKLSEQGLKLVAKHEGLKLKPYLCPANIPTIGYGNTEYENGQKVTLNDTVISKERAEELLKNIVIKFEDGIKKLVKVPLTQHQFDALVSFTYNIGLGNFSKSTLLKLLNNGDYEGASKEFQRWNKAGGKVLSGLIRRRKEEMELFLKTV
jgi:lysozyme